MLLAECRCPGKPVLEKRKGAEVCWRCGGAVISRSERRVARLPEV